MTLRLLADDFPCRSEGAARAPAELTRAELLTELEEELARRRKVYPRLVDAGTMKPSERDHHVAVWQALIADHHAAEEGERATGAGFDWEARVRELRRELALRRTAYPKWVASATNPLTAADARRKLEALDAIHWRYWMGLFAFAIADEPWASPRRAAHVATRELTRNEPAIAAARAAGGIEAALAMRLSNHWQAIARLAHAIAAGERWSAHVDGAALLRLRDTAYACWAHQNAAGVFGDPIADARADQLVAVDTWLDRLVYPRQPAALAAPERLAA